MKILINEKQLHILVEQTKTNEKIYNRPGDPYEYKFQNNTWFARKKGTDGQFLDITKYQKSVDILNKEFPQVKVQTTKKIEQPEKKETKNLSNEKISTNSLFQKKLEEVAKNLGFQKEWLVKIIEKESKMNPKAKNSIGCVGLIQFCPDTPRGTFKTIGDKKYDLEEVRNMSAVQQLDLVQEFFKPHASKIKNYEDLYFITFYPYALGKPEHFVIGSEKKDPNYALKLSKQNPAIANAAGKTPGVDTLTVADFRKYLKI